MNLFKATSRIARSGRALFLPLWFSHLPLYYLFVTLPVLLALLWMRPAHANPTLVLHSDTEIATAGYYQLRWEWPEVTPATRFILLESAVHEGADTKRIIYSGSDTASVISGKPDGIYAYSVQVLDGRVQPVAQSDRVQVMVEHHSLTRAIGFFMLGAIVFVATLLVILRSAARYKQE